MRRRPIDRVPTPLPPRSKRLSEVAECSLDGSRLQAWNDNQSMDEDSALGPVPAESPELRFRPNSLNAFSLIEVTLALGIVMFALIVIFSLIPTGLNTLSAANRQMIEIEIFSTVTAELNATSFEKLEDYVQDRFPAYFDVEGLEVSAESAVFTVRCELSPVELEGQLRRAAVLVGFQSDPVDSSAGGASVVKRGCLLVDRGI